MTPQQINRAIAEAVGWKPSVPVPPGHGGIPLFTYKEWLECSLPNYYGNLNAIHEAEGTIENGEYYETLKDVCGRENVGSAFTATAAQRAEAFLRTIGKWEDGE